MKFSFLVKGSSEVPYEVKFVKRSETNISAYCTCKAGQNGMSCKHRMNILNGKTIGIVSDNLEDVELVKSWFPGSDIEEAMREVNLIEKEITGLKKELKAAKKAVAMAMLN